MLIPIIQPPVDGFLNFEKVFIKDILISVYRTLPDPITKFIMVSYFECGYNQEQISMMLGITQEAVNKRIKKAQAKLRESNIFAELV